MYFFLVKKYIAPLFEPLRKQSSLLAHRAQMKTLPKGVFSFVRDERLELPTFAV